MTESYRPDNWLGAKSINIALNLRNLFDQRYIGSAQNTTARLYFGEPRTVLATMG
jgi:iron complex outermembrane receptor protein